MKIIEREDFYHIMHPKVTFLVSAGKESKVNVCACSWGTPLSEEPPLMGIALSKEIYTAELIRKYREFVLNVPDEKMLNVVWGCGSTSGRRVNKSEKFGFVYAEGKQVQAPRVKGCIGYIECKLRRTVDAGECYFFIGEVLHAEVNEKVYSKGWKDNALLLLHVWGKEFRLPGRKLRVK